MRIRSRLAAVVVPCLALFVGSGAAQALTIDLHAGIHARGVGVDQPRVVTLDAGEWVVTPVAGTYQAYSPWETNTGCVPSCVPVSPTALGYLHRYGVAVAGVDRIAPADTWDGLAYDLPADALANATGGLSFLLTGTTDVEFYIPTGLPLADNRGGVSLSLALVPEPSVPGLLLLGATVGVRRLRHRV